jgi:hypothetical protein
VGHALVVQFVDAVVEFLCVGASVPSWWVSSSSW